MSVREAEEARASRNLGTKTRLVLTMAKFPDADPIGQSMNAPIRRASRVTSVGVVNSRNDAIAIFSL